MSAMMHDDSLLSTLLGVKAISERDVKNFRELNGYLAEGDMGNAYRALDRLPESYRKTRDWAMLRVGVAGFDEHEYRAALERLAADFGSDPSVQFMLIDHYYYQGRFDLAYQAISSFESTIGGEDAVTNFLKCSSLLSWSHYAEAVKACRRGIELEPDFKPAYWGIVSIGLQSSDPQTALAGLSAYERAFGMQFDPDKLAALEQYRALARTPEFALWAKPRRAADSEKR
jgi:tetratricopeptide (TPR) repeat protein